MGRSLLPSPTEEAPDISGRMSSSVPDVFASIPKKLADKILTLEFVDMADLPEQWRIEENRDGGCCSLQKVNKKRLLTDILLWLECYSTMVAVLASGYPDKAAHFMAYQQTIIHASKNFPGAAWASYDLCFRRKAAAVRKCLQVLTMPLHPRVLKMPEG